MRSPKFGFFSCTFGVLHIPLSKCSWTPLVRKLFCSTKKSLLLLGSHNSATVHGSCSSLFSNKDVLKRHQTFCLSIYPGMMILRKDEWFTWKAKEYNVRICFKVFSDSDRLNKSILTRVAREPRKFITKVLSQMVNQLSLIRLMHWQMATHLFLDHTMLNCLWVIWSKCMKDWF